MRTWMKLVAGTTAAVSVTALAIAPAQADPPRGVVPRASAIVSVGAQTDQFLLDQLSVDYNQAHKTGSRLYTWDALDPAGVDNTIVTKTGAAPILRPNGSGAGVSALILNAKAGKFFAIDFARTSSPRSASDPPDAKGGVVFVALATDAVTYATNTGSNAPAHLTIAQLAAIYNCTATTWNQVGGTSHATIDAQLPQTSSGTRKFFLAAIGVTAPGACVDNGRGESPNFLPEENEGTDRFLQGPNVIFPYSVGAWIGQVFHSAGPGKNIFGKDLHAKLQVRDIKLTNGVVTTPTVGSGTKTKINTKFDSVLLRTLYDVVRWAATKDNIPRYLEPFLASAANKGWICSSKEAQQAVLNYGFLNTPFCGHGS